MLQLVMCLVCALVMVLTVAGARKVLETLYHKLQGKPFWMQALSGIAVVLIEMLILVAILALMTL